MPLRQTDRRTNDELEDGGWEQHPTTRKEKHPYRVSGLVQHEMGGRSLVLQGGARLTEQVYHTLHQALSTTFLPDMSRDRLRR
jgi:hypothetical protein